LDGAAKETHSGRRIGAGEVAMTKSEQLREIAWVRVPARLLPGI
jgi:hypothetical protein